MGFRSGFDELRVQRGIALPMVAMNLAWFAKTAITTAFLGRLGELSLAGGALGFTFANVTGFSVLNGLCGAMEPIYVDRLMVPKTSGSFTRPFSWQSRCCYWYHFPSLSCGLMLTRF